MNSVNFAARFFVALLFISFFTACDDEDVVVTTGEGRFALEITDAPVDDPSIQGVFVTVADVKIGGVSVEGFSRTTIEISALQNGATQLLADANLEARAYSGVEVVLDAANDAANSGGPGCYVLTDANEKVALDLSGDGSLFVSGSDFELEQGSTFAAVIDFDLRKAITRTEEESMPYAFAAQNRLTSSLRFVNKAEAGTLEGNVANNSSETGTFVVFAYEAGTFSAAEMNGEDDEIFLNAEASARVSSSGDYKLSFLESGEYELIVAAYEDEDNDGEVEFKGRLRLETLLNINLGRVAVGANSTTTADISLLGLFP